MAQHTGVGDSGALPRPPSSAARTPSRRGATDAPGRSVIKVPISELDAMPGTQGDDDHLGEPRLAASDKPQPPLPAEVGESA